MTTQELKNTYLAFWNLACKEPVKVSDVRDRLAANGLKRERAQDVPAGTGMRRAADAVKSKTVETKTFTCKESGRVRTQVDSLTEENGRLRRDFVGQYELDENDVPVHIAGKELPALQERRGCKTHSAGNEFAQARWPARLAMRLWPSAGVRVPEFRLAVDSSSPWFVPGRGNPRRCRNRGDGQESVTP